MRAGSAPLARTCPCPRWVLVMRSSGRSAAQTPAAIASSPMYGWIPPTITPARTSSIALSSNRRISRTVRYSSAASAIVSVGRVPGDGAVVRVAVVGVTVGLATHEHVVVVRDGLAGAQNVRTVRVRAVLQMEGDGPAGPRASVGPAAVVDPAMVEAHVPLGNVHRHLDDLDVV